MVEQREVDKETARAFCDENAIEKYFETSSVSGYNVEEVFSMSAKDMYVRECIQNTPPTPQQKEQGKKQGGANAGKKGGPTKGNVNLDKGRSLADKKKEKGCC